jgi:hypothetical protein
MIIRLIHQTASCKVVLSAERGQPLSSSEWKTSFSKPETALRIGGAMKKQAVTGLVFLAGFLLGIGFSVFLTGKDGDPVGAEVAADAGEPTGGETAALLARIRDQEAEIVRLRAGQAREPAETELEEEREGSSGDEPRPGFGRRIEERMANRVRELVETYGLNATQNEQLAEAFSKQIEAFRARRRGEDVPAFNLDDAMADILTDEQFAAYVEETQEEIYNRAELMATSQLVRLSQTVELLPGQEELVYDAVHYTAQEMMVARQTGEDFPMREVLTQRLGDILTTEQMEHYLETGIGRGPGWGP